MTMAERMRIYRARKKNGSRMVRISVHKTDIRWLQHLGLIGKGKSPDPKDVQNGFCQMFQLAIAATSGTAADLTLIDFIDPPNSHDR